MVYGIHLHVHYNNLICSDSLKIVESCMMEKPTSRPLAVSVKKQLRALNSNKLNPVDLMMMMVCLNSGQILNF